MGRSNEGFHWNAAGGRTEGLETPAVVSSTPEHLLRNHYDVIVLGAGFAGLTAARDLSMGGLSVLVIEARDRIGGRTWTAEVDGTKVEIGGTWVHWFQPHVWCELKRYNLDQFDATPLGNDDRLQLYVDQDSRLMEIPNDPKEMENIVQEYMSFDGVLGRNILPLPHNPQANLRALREADQLSVLDRVNQMDNLTPAQKTILAAVVAGPSVATPEKAAYIDYLRWFALSGFALSTTQETAVGFKIAKGTTSLALAIFNDFKGHTIFNQKVTSIDQDAATCSVRTSTGQIFKAKKIISTAPLNVASSIEYSPPLPSLHLEAFQKGHCCRGGKFHAYVENELSNGYTLTGQIPLPIPMGLSDGVNARNEHHVVFFASETAQLRDTNKTLAQIRELHPDGFSVKSMIGMDWENDEFAQGMWCMFEKGYFTKYWDELKKNHGSVIFASADIADGWRGFIDGAIEEGKRAASLVLSDKALSDLKTRL